MALILCKACRFVASSSIQAAAVAPRLGGGLGTRAFATVFAEEDKAFHIWNLLEAKKKSKLTFTQIAERTGLTNAYVAQLFYRQAHLKKDTVPALKAAVPDLTDDDLEVMQEIPFRSYQRDIIRTEPLIYRLEEAMLHYGIAIKAIVNENFGDGIMSAIDVYVDVAKTKGKLGEDRVRITLDGKFLPHIEQSAANVPAAPSSSSSSAAGSAKKVAAAAAPKGGGRGRSRKQQTASLSTLAASPSEAGAAEEKAVLEAAPTRLLGAVVGGEGAVVVRRGRGRPAGSKNKPKAQILL